MFTMKSKIDRNLLTPMQPMSMFDMHFTVVKKICRKPADVPNDELKGWKKRNERSTGWECNLGPKKSVAIFRSTILHL